MKMSSLHNAAHGAGLKNSRGMTLIEILLVLMIMAGLTAGGVYMINMVTHSQLKDESMRFITTAQYTYDQAALNNRQYRLVIDLDTNEYYTEVTDADVVITDTEEDTRGSFDEGLLPEEARELEEQRRSERRGLFDDKEDDPFGISQRTGYQRAEDRVIEPRELRHGIEFESVRTENREQPVRRGRAAISFFPSGQQQQAHVVLVDPSTEAQFTLVTEPLTGRIIAYSGEREIDDDFGEEEYEQY